MLPGLPQMGKSWESWQVAPTLLLIPMGMNQLRLHRRLISSYCPCGVLKLSYNYTPMFCGISHCLFLFILDVYLVVVSPVRKVRLSASSPATTPVPLMAAQFAVISRWSLLPDHEVFPVAVEGRRADQSIFYVSVATLRLDHKLYYGTQHIWPESWTPHGDVVSDQCINGKMVVCILAEKITFILTDHLIESWVPNSHSWYAHPLPPPINQLQWWGCGAMAFCNIAHKLATNGTLLVQLS